MNISPKSLFDRRFENLFNAISLLGVVLCVLELLSAFRLSPAQQQLSHIIVNVLFFGNSHVLFTPIFLFCTHPGRKWLKNSSPRLRIHSWIIFLVPAIAAGTCYYLLWEQGREWFRGLYYAASAYHIGRQSWGFQKLTQVRFDGTDAASFSAQSYLVHALIAVNCVLQFNYIRPTPIPTELKTVLVIVLALGALALFAHLFRRSPTTSGRLYAVRTWTLYPLQHLSSFAFYAYVLLHAAEYLFVTLKLFSASQKTQKRGLLFFISIIVIFAFVASFRLFDLPPFRQHFDAVLTHRALPSVLIGISFGFSFLHYWLDSVLFTRSNAGSREHILPSIWARSG